MYGGHGMVLIIQKLCFARNREKRQVSSTFNQNESHIFIYIYLFLFFHCFMLLCNILNKITKSLFIYVTLLFLPSKLSYSNPVCCFGKYIIQARSKIFRICYVTIFISFKTILPIIIL